jgi:hypothetical protein
MIGSYDSLLKASQGRMAPRVVTPPAPILEPYSGGLDKAGRANDLAQAQMASGPSLLSGFNRASGGLSAKGKYSGFFSAGDQEAAIIGAATDLKGDAATYRAKADAFMNKLDPIYAESSKGPSRAFMSQGTAQMPGVNEKNWQKVTPGGYIDKIVNPSRKYANQLNDWYTQQSAPAVKYQATADQIERTPISEFATQIATNSYGMNPDLARGKFSGLDATYYKQQQDADSMAKYGMPYDEYQKQQEDLAYGTKNKKINSAIEAEAASELDAIAGVGSNFLSAATGQTAAQMYKVAENEFIFTDPKDNVKKQANGLYFIQQYSTYLDEGKLGEAENLLNSIPQERQDLSRLIRALQSVKLQKMGKAAVGTMTYESFLQSLSDN